MSRHIFLLGNTHVTTFCLIVYSSCTNKVPPACRNRAERGRAAPEYADRDDFPHALSDEPSKNSAIWLQILGHWFWKVIMQLRIISRDWEYNFGRIIDMDRVIYEQIHSSLQILDTDTVITVRCSPAGITCRVEIHNDYNVNYDPRASELNSAIRAHGCFWPITNDSNVTNVEDNFHFIHAHCTVISTGHLTITQT